MSELTLAEQRERERLAKVLHMVRHGLKALLEEKPDLEIVGEAERAAAMLAAGAWAYVDKIAGADALITTIRGDAMNNYGA